MVAVIATTTSDEIALINVGENPNLKIGVAKDYSCPSDSAPESLKPFYDPGLTEALNR